MKVCPYCIVTKGLKGTDLIKGGEKDMDDIEVFAEHMEKEHNIPVRRDNETEKQCKERFYNKYPEAKNSETCKCPKCKAKRGDIREALVSEIRR